MPTLGEYRVGIDFNPSKNPTVSEIKSLAAALIDKINAIPMLIGLNDPRPSEEFQREFGRLKALAMTHVEDAAMWAVKATTKTEFHHEFSDYPHERA